MIVGLHPGDRLTHCTLDGLGFGLYQKLHPAPIASLSSCFHFYCGEIIIGGRAYILDFVKQSVSGISSAYHSELLIFSHILALFCLVKWCWENHIHFSFDKIEVSVCFVSLESVKINLGQFYLDV